MTQVLETLSVLDRSRDVELGHEAAVELGVPAGRWTLNRAWPRGNGDRMLLEYRLGVHRLAGQWFAAGDRRDEVCASTRRRHGGLGSALVVEDVLLQSHGADRRLPALAELLATPGASLVGHRPERRAVVAFNGPVRFYAKVVHAGGADGLLSGAEVAQRLPVPTPALLTSGGDGVTRWSALPGDALHACLNEPAVRAAARAVRAVHDAPVDAQVGLHGRADELEVIDTWICRVRPFDAALAVRLAEARDGVAAHFAAVPTGPTSPIHRDLHDKQILIAGARAGLLDFDLVSAGEAALDVANLLVHFELRAHQGLLRWSDAEALSAAFLDEYQPSAAVRGALDAYAAATRARLAAVYRFRPASAHVVPRFLADLARAVV